MNVAMRAFLDSILIQNPVVMTFVGALLAVVVPRSARSSLRPALRFSVALFFAGLVGATLTTMVPIVAAPMVFLAVGLATTALLLALGELRDTWMGMPQAILGVAPLIGVQILVGTYGEPAAMVAASGGNAVGFAIMFVLIGAIRESSRISESSDTFKTNPVVLFSMAVFALALTGFLFW
ncbi:MAG: hypothetical protein EA403_13860 [Spirochaetaceae bacterium]|nr:MAG: hypothetical protein EA403_13860 [Spirochaetaceae bacterium]